MGSNGPIIREENGKWVSIRLMQEPIKALTQSYTRTKAKDYKSFRQTPELKANSSNNTIFADADGDIAYWQGNFIPNRDPRFDYTKPVDGSDPATNTYAMRVAKAPRMPVILSKIMSAIWWLASLKPGRFALI